ncbi:DUF3237 domain-containing protein [Microbacterium invictum]|uniref:UPF0311 protein BKA10_002318 n=1 Tax=Microbacterium invictum TaxID=515415 RepID=A0AA40VN75_9MICO|nr:DUF3237 domain-containing protein [Microbacterium invictum]MBB4140524.1 hypothetical protein [Microbacterium invictum]
MTSLPAAAHSVAAPALRHVSTIRVEVDEPIDLGEGVDGRRRIVPIRSGTATGEMSGRIRAGGADFQVLRPDAVTELEARYPLELDDGTMIEIVNHGIRAGSVDDVAKLMRGEPVDPDRIYFRCSPRLRAPQGAWDWVNRTVFVGTGVRRPTSVEVQVFAVE